MGLLYPLALLALPLALLPLWLEWRGLRTGRPIRFSSLYLVERARRAPAPRLPTRSRWVALLRAAAIALLVLAAARPVGCGSGEAGSHRPTRAVVAVDVSASTGQLHEGRPAWEGIRSAADSILAAAGADDRVALTAVADGIVGWWEGPGPELRARLAALRPGDRASDWPRTLAALATRTEDDTESYLLTDGSRGAVPPRPGTPPRGRAIVGIRGETPPGNRSLVDATWIGEGTVAVAGVGRGDAPAAAEVGRSGGGDLRDPRPIPLDGSIPPAGWILPDTGTFVFREVDALGADDRLYVARGGSTGRYEIVRWTPVDEPPESGPLFWEAAILALGGSSRVDRTASLASVASSGADLALLPIRSYRPDEARALARMAAAGTRLLFSPACASPACAPPPGWFPAGDVDLPDLSLVVPPGSSPLTGSPDRAAGSLPEPLLDPSPVRGTLVPGGGPASDWTWDLVDGRSALWVRGPIAIWLIPLGPPHTRLATTPVFPAVARASLEAWDPRWTGPLTGTRVGEPMPPLPAGAVVEGPLQANGERSRWEVAPGSPPPRPERAGLYRVDDPAGSTIFLAVNGDPAEGDLARVPAADWEAAWGPVVPAGEWAAAVFPRRRGPELWAWALVLATLALVAEAAVRHVRPDK